MQFFRKRGLFVRAPARQKKLLVWVSGNTGNSQAPPNVGAQLSTAALTLGVPSNRSKSPSGLRDPGLGGGAQSQIWMRVPSFDLTPHRGTTSQKLLARGPLRGVNNVKSEGGLSLSE